MKGCVYLGDLKQCLVVSAMIKDFEGKEFRREWKVVDDHDAFVFPRQVNLLEGENLELPVNFGKAERDLVSISRMANDGKILEDVFEQVGITKQGD